MKSIAQLATLIFKYLATFILLDYLVLSAYIICLNLHAQFIQHLPHTHAQTHLYIFINCLRNMKNTLLLLYDYHKLKNKIKIYTTYADFIYNNNILIGNHYRITTQSATHLLSLHFCHITVNTIIATNILIQITFTYFFTNGQ